jgi:hypothetical protein
MPTSVNATMSVGVTTASPLQSKGGLLRGQLSADATTVQIDRNLDAKRTVNLDVWMRMPHAVGEGGRPFHPPLS